MSSSYYIIIGNSWMEIIENGSPYCAHCHKRDWTMQVWLYENGFVTFVIAPTLYWVQKAAEKNNGLLSTQHWVTVVYSVESE